MQAVLFAIVWLVQGHFLEFLWQIEPNTTKRVRTKSGYHDLLFYFDV